LNCIRRRPDSRLQPAISLRVYRVAAPTKQLEEKDAQNKTGTAKNRKNPESNAANFHVAFSLKPKSAFPPLLLLQRFGEDIR
jgi:hypothetical protein